MSLAATGGLFGWAWVAFAFGPALVGRRAWAVRRPRAALRVWAALFVTGAVGAVLGLALLLRSAAEVSRELGSGQQLTACQTCHAAAVYGASWVLTAALTTLVGVGLCRWTGLAMRRYRTRCASSDAAAALPAEVVDGVRVTLLTSERYAAGCAPGRHAHVVVTTALRALLDPDELRSVVAHESAHLHRGHRLLQAIARLHGGQRALALLVELAADDRAARQCGPAVTAAALTKVAEASHDETMRLRARRTALAA